MLTLLDVVNWIEPLIDCGGNIAVSNIDGNKDKFIGIYDQKTNSRPQRVVLGEKAKYFEKSISILIHWTNNPSQAEIKAHEVYQVLMSVSNSTTESGIKIVYVKSIALISLGRDEKGIFEYVIDANIIYMKGND